MNTSRTRIRVAVRNIAAAAVVDGLTTQEVAGVTAAVAAAVETQAQAVPIIRHTCRAPMLRVRTPRAVTRAAAEIGMPDTETAAAVVAAVAGPGAAVVAAQAAAAVAADLRVAHARVEAAVAVVHTAAVSRAAASPAMGMAAASPA